MQPRDVFFLINAWRGPNERSKRRLTNLYGDFAIFLLNLLFWLIWSLIFILNLSFKLGVLDYLFIWTIIPEVPFVYLLTGVILIPCKLEERIHEKKRKYKMILESTNTKENRRTEEMKMKPDIICLWMQLKCYLT